MIRLIPCSRRRCENHRCARQTIWHNICDDCFEELVALGADADLDGFMASPKPSPDGAAESRKYWEHYFRAYRPRS